MGLSCFQSAELAAIQATCVALQDELATCKAVNAELQNHNYRLQERSAKDHQAHRSAIDAHSEHLSHVVDARCALEADNAGLLASKASLQAEIIVHLKALRVADEKLAAAKQEVADKDFELEQLKVAYKCTAQYSVEQEAAKAALEERLALASAALSAAAMQPRHDESAHTMHHTNQGAASPQSSYPYGSPFRRPSTAPSSTQGISIMPSPDPSAPAARMPLHPPASAAGAGFQYPWANNGTVSMLSNTSSRVASISGIPGSPQLRGPLGDTLGMLEVDGPLPYPPTPASSVMGGGGMGSGSSGLVHVVRGRNMAGAGSKGPRSYSAPRGVQPLQGALTLPLPLHALLHPAAVAAWHTHVQKGNMDASRPTFGSSSSSMGWHMPHGGSASEGATPLPGRSSGSMGMLPHVDLAAAAAKAAAAAGISHYDPGIQSMQSGSGPRCSGSSYTAAAPERCPLGRSSSSIHTPIGELAASSFNQDVATAESARDGDAGSAAGMADHALDQGHAEAAANAVPAKPQPAVDTLSIDELRIECVKLRVANTSLQRQVAQLQKQNDLLQLKQLGGGGGQGQGLGLGPAGPGQQYNSAAWPASASSMLPSHAVASVLQPSAVKWFGNDIFSSYFGTVLTQQRQHQLQQQQQQQAGLGFGLGLPMRMPLATVPEEGRLPWDTTTTPRMARTAPGSATAMLPLECTPHYDPSAAAGLTGTSGSLTASWGGSIDKPVFAQVLDARLEPLPAVPAGPRIIAKLHNPEHHAHQHPEGLQRLVLRATSSDGGVPRTSSDGSAALPSAAEPEGPSSSDRFGTPLADSSMQRSRQHSSDGGAGQSYRGADAPAAESLLPLAAPSALGGNGAGAPATALRTASSGGHVPLTAAGSTDAVLPAPPPGMDAALWELELLCAGAIVPSTGSTKPAAVASHRASASQPVSTSTVTVTPSAPWWNETHTAPPAPPATGVANNGLGMLASGSAGQGSGLVSRGMSFPTVCKTEALVSDITGVSQPEPLTGHTTAHGMWLPG